MDVEINKTTDVVRITMQMMTGITKVQQPISWGYT